MSRSNSKSSVLLLNRRWAWPSDETAASACEEVVESADQLVRSRSRNIMPTRGLPITTAVLFWRWQLIADTCLVDGPLQSRLDLTRCFRCLRNLGWLRDFLQAGERRWLLCLPSSPSRSSGGGVVRPTGRHNIAELEVCRPKRLVTR